MKCEPVKELFDWNAIHNPVIQNQFTVAAQNRYDALVTGEGSATEAYEHLQANKEAAKELIPLWKKTKKNCVSDDARVQDARKDVQRIFAIYQNQSNSDSQENLQKAKAKLQDAYDAVTEDELAEMIPNVELADGNRRCGESWRLINFIKSPAGKSPKICVLKGISREDRLSKWQQYFSQQLGNEPTVESDPDEIIPPILENVDIRTDLFDTGE